MRKYVRDFFDKAVEKDKERQKRRAERNAKEGKAQNSLVGAEKPGVGGGEENPRTEDLEMATSDQDEEDLKPESTTPATPLDQLSLEGLKRKRDQLFEENGLDCNDPESTPNKRVKSETPPPPPPPPPPAPTDGVYPEMDHDLNEELLDGMETFPTDLMGSAEELEAPSVDPPASPLVHVKDHTDGDGEGSHDEEHHQLNGVAPESSPFV